MASFRRSKKIDKLANLINDDKVYSKILLQPYDPAHPKITIENSSFSFNDEMFFLYDDETKKLKFLCPRNFIACITFIP